MPLKTHQYIRNGIQYDVLDFTGTQNIQTTRRLIGMLAPSLGAGLGTLDHAALKNIGEMDMSMFGKLVENIALQLNTPEGETLVRMLCAQVTVHEQREHGTFPVRLTVDGDGFDSYFAGPEGPGRLVEVVQLMVMHAFGPFVRGLVGKFASRAPKSNA